MSESANIGRIEPVKVLRCDVSPDSPKELDLVVQFQNGHAAELHLSPDLDTVRKIMDECRKIEQNLLGELPPPQGQWAVLPGGGKP